MSDRLNGRGELIGKRHWPPCHARAIRHDDQRSTTVDDAHSPASDQDGSSRWSRAGQPYRSSKLVMRVRFPSPAPTEVPGQGVRRACALRCVSPRASTTSRDWATQCAYDGWRCGPQW